PEEVKRLYGLKTQYFRELNQVKIMPGAQKMLSVFRENGVTPVLVTGSGQASLLDRLNTDFDNAFSAGLRVTGNDVTHGKPHPEPYLRALEKAGVGQRQAIAVENAPLGVRSASDAGVFTIGVTTGPIPRPEMEAAGADIVFDSMPECADLLSQLLYKLNN
ncbi:MAG: HAD-IA family hydrolase, partial [Muribaculaceae bacterium]|nr:HAD-IA family hydrolase [Muribaculaceae bacterium]